MKVYVLIAEMSLHDEMEAIPFVYGVYATREMAEEVAVGLSNYKISEHEVEQ